MRSLYTLAVKGYGLLIAIAATWNAKARAWKEGRASQREQALELPTAGKAFRIWLHCASAGEFEQGRPIAEALCAQHERAELVLTFFSPSGYEMRKDYPLAIRVLYLPLDTPRQMHAFLEELNPGIAIFVKYELWHNCLRALHERGVPAFLVSARFRATQIYFKSWGGWWARQLQHFEYIFTQDEKSLSLLQKIGINRAACAGDTRFDRVAQLAEAGGGIEEIERFKGSSKLLLAGSTWPADESLIANWWQRAAANDSDWKLVIAPHEIDGAHIRSLRARFEKADLWSEIGGGTFEGKVLILDTMGLLKHAYFHADIAYVGGGFGAGIHNVPEAVAYGIPAVFGPRYRKFAEAIDLIELGAAKSVRIAAEFAEAMHRYMHDEALRQKAGQKGKLYIFENKGATALIVDKLKGYLQRNQ